MSRYTSNTKPGPRFDPGPSGAEIATKIKEWITIPMLAENLFPGWLPAKSCLSPFRDERNNSFSVYADGTRWKDQGTGEYGTVIDFYAKAHSCGEGHAIKALKEMMGGNSLSPIIRAREAVPEEGEKQQYHPDLSVPTDAELDEISRRRSICVEALKIAVERGFLYTAILKGERAFVVTDKTRKNYRARRIDGRPWDPGKKAYCLYGSQAAWPIGIQEAEAFPSIALCEGETDFLAAFGHAYASGVEDQVAPVCIAGAGNRIPTEALPLFKDKRVRIFVHGDRQGEEAWERWSKQLNGIAEVDGFDFYGLITTEGSPVTDLNDMLRIDYDCWEENKTTIAGVMNFAPERKS